MPEQTRTNALMLTAIVGLAISAGAASAQRATEDAPQARREPPMLAGPRVREQRMPGVESGFSAGAEQGRRMGAGIVPPQVFHKVLGELMAEDAPLRIRLSAEQRERIGAHVRAFEHASGQDRPRGPQQERDGTPDAAGRPSRPPLDRGKMEHDRPPRPPAGDRAPASDRSEMGRPDGMHADGNEPGGHAAGPDNHPRPEAGRDRGRETPRAALARLQNQVWAELSAAQQAHVGQAIEAWRAQAAEQQTDRMRDRYRREIGARFDEMDAGPKGPQAGEQGRAAASDGEFAKLRAWLSQLPEDAQQRIHRRLESIPQERRQALLTRLEGMSPQQLERLKRRLLAPADGSSRESDDR